MPAPVLSVRVALEDILLPSMKPSELSSWTSSLGTLSTHVESINET